LRTAMSSKMGSIIKKFFRAINKEWLSL